MIRVFITYSHADEGFVDRLLEELEISGLDVTLDKRVLRPGDSLIKIFGEIGTCNFLLPILSSTSIKSNWVKKELETAIIKEIEEPDFRVIPIIKNGEDWSQLRSTMPQSLQEALRSKYAARFDIKSHEDAIKELLPALTPAQDAQELYSKIYAAKGDNPFRRVRAEYFEDRQSLARSFAEPENVLYDRIVEVKPALIEGGRGSGKTMLLKSLEARVSVFRREARNIAQTDLDYFGAYSRLTQGAFATQEGHILEHVKLDVATLLFKSELILQLVQSLVEEMYQCAQHHVIEINAAEESALVEEIENQIRPTDIPSQNRKDFASLKRFIQIELRKVSDYLGRRVFGESATYGGVFLDKEELAGICSKVVQVIFKTSNSATVYFLLDEYENLLPFQKVVLNTLVKWAQTNAFSIKLGTKKTGFQDPRTLERQELEEGHDYSPVDLDYDLSNDEHRKNYKDLLANICRKVLKSEGYKVVEIQSLLEESLPFDGLPSSEIDAMIITMIKTQSGRDWNELDDRQRNEYRHRLEMGAFYRILKSKKKTYAGFDDLALLSSGIVRYFLELCGMSYYFAIQDGTDVKKGGVIKVQHQKDAAYTLSSYYIATIRKNIVDHGPHIQQFTIDLGDIFRQKLLNHLSEPEAARLTISDPHILNSDAMADVKTILDTAVMHSVLQTRGGIGGIRPKHTTDVQPKEYLLNRIYAPELKYSPRPRWRTELRAKDVGDLLDPNSRREVKSRLIRKVSSLPVEDKVSTDARQSTFLQQQAGDDDGHS
jgi:hypothetical protein